MFSLRNTNHSFNLFREKRINEWFRFLQMSCTQVAKIMSRIDVPKRRSMKNIKTRFTVIKTPCLRSLFKAPKRLFFHGGILRNLKIAKMSEVITRSSFTYQEQKDTLTPSQLKTVLIGLLFLSFEFASGSSCPTSHLFSTE